MARTCPICSAPQQRPPRPTASWQSLPNSSLSSPPEKRWLLADCGAAVLLAVQNLSVRVPVQLLTWNFDGVSLGGLLAMSALLGGLCLLVGWAALIVASTRLP